MIPEIPSLQKLIPILEKANSRDSHFTHINIEEKLVQSTIPDYYLSMFWP